MRYSLATFRTAFAEAMPIVTEPDLLKYRRTKIIATLGPVSSHPAMIDALITSGVDVFRVNMSHGNQTDHGRTIAAIRASADKLGTPTAILADLCGPKIRTGKFAGGIARLQTHAKVRVTTDDVLGNETVIVSQYPALADDLVPGNRILLNDGAVELVVESIADGELFCEVVVGGMLGDHKGINLPGSAVSAPSLTDKDRLDARFALDAGVDFLALSFVRQASDISDLKALVDECNGDVQIIAKIEKPEALDHSDAIINQADAIMVARGDLGVELSPEQVPLAQAQLITQARALNTPVIIATQMLESMISNARPTRAEVSDVSFAVASRADAVMLSGESAVGDYAVEAVQMMDRVARQTESYHSQVGLDLTQLDSATALDIRPYADAVADATAKLVSDVGARAVLVISMRGMTAATISAARPTAPVVAVTNDLRVWRSMSLMWGIIPHFDAATGQENPNTLARRVALQLGLVETGEYIVLVRGFHPDPLLNSPSITLLQLP